MVRYRIAPPLLILKEACAEAGLDVEFIGEESGHLAKVSRGSDFFYSGGAGTPTYPLNSAVSQDLCADKAYAYQLLEQAGLAVPEGRLFFPGFEKRNPFEIDDRGLADAIRYVSKVHSFPVIVKPNRGSMGRGVRLVDNDTDLVLAMHETLEFGHACLVQTLVKGTECRLFCIDGEPRFFYRKVRPHIIGDGVHSISELLQRSGQASVVGEDVVYLENELRHHADRFIRGSHSDSLWDGILKDGEYVEFSVTGNLASGARISEFCTDIPQVYHELARQVYEVLGVRIAGIDFFEGSAVSSLQDAVIIEVNGNPSLRGAWDAGHKDVCLGIWFEIFEKYFKIPSIEGA